MTIDERRKAYLVWDALEETPALFRKYLPAPVLPDETPAEAGNPIH